MRIISITWRRELSSRFFPAQQGAEGNSHHSDGNIRGICTIDFFTSDVPRPGQSKTVTTPEIIDSGANLGKLLDFG